jgi:formate dehydrogenase subunit gamma
VVGVRERKGRGPVEPPEVTAPPEVMRAVAAAVERHRGERGPLIQMLHTVQAELGHVPTSAVPVLADALNLSPADVYGVLTFYHDFHQDPVGRQSVRICRAEACQSLGAEALVDHAVRRLGVDLGQTSADGEVTLQQVFCFGNCALGPTVEVDGQIHGRVSAGRFDALVGESR